MKDKKTIFFFLMFWKDGLSKQLSMEYHFCCIIKKILFFPTIWSYSLDGKWKMIFLIKLHRNMIFSSNVLKGCSFKKTSHQSMKFLVLSGKMEFLFPKNVMEDERWKIKDAISQKLLRNMTFSVYMYKLYKYDITLLPKKAKVIFSRKKYN